MTGTVLDTTLIYNKRKDEWISTNTPTLPVGVSAHALSPINRANSKFLLTGGWTASGPSDLGYVYDWWGKTWTQVGRMHRGPIDYHQSIFYRGADSSMDKV